MMGRREFSPKPLEEIVVVEKPRAVVAGPELLSALPDIDKHFIALDARIANDPNAWYGGLQSTVEEIPEYPGLFVSIRQDDRVTDTNKLGVMLAPLDSTYPQSSHLEVVRYARKEKEEITKWDKHVAKPNTWNEIGKLATMSEVAIQQGIGMNMVTIYRPVPKDLFTKEELDMIEAGDTSPWGKIIKIVANYAQEKLHGQDSETQIDELYLYEAGMGHEMVGAADWLQANDEKRFVKALITPNLITGIKNRWELLKKYSVSATFGSPSELIVPEDYWRIPEPLMRLHLDKRGAEFSMRKRQFRAMVGLWNPGAMIHPGPLQAAMLRVVENGTKFLAPIGVNTNISRKTLEYVPMGHQNFWLLPVLAVKDQVANLGTNENYSLNGVLFVEGVMFADDWGKRQAENGAKV